MHIFVSVVLTNGTVPICFRLYAIEKIVKYCRSKEQFQEQLADIKFVFNLPTSSHGNFKLELENLIQFHGALTYICRLYSLQVESDKKDQVMENSSVKAEVMSSDEIVLFYVYF